MARHIEDEVVYYYDLYPTKEDLMGETAIHDWLVDYLKQVLRWLFREQSCAIYANLNFYQTAQYKEEPLAPDLAVIKGSDFQFVTSWRVGQTGGRRLRGLVAIRWISTGKLTACRCTPQR